MRAPEPLDPETVAALEAIDATLDGEPVDPDHAELAELSLILRDERPEPDAVFLAGLDARVAARFADPTRRRRTLGSRRAWWGSASALAATAAVALLLVLVLNPSRSRVSELSSAAGTATVSSSTTAAGGASGAASNGAASGSATSGSATSGSATSGSATSGSATSGSSTKVPASAPAPRSGRGRDVTQSAQLALRARPGQIGPVAQEVFDVVGAEQGNVISSQVVDRAGATGDARFSLQVPSAHLQSTLTRLSALRGAQVSSRTDASADITGQVNTTAAQLATARALRASLLRQLAAATTASQVDGLKGQLRANEATIVADSASLASLHAKVADSPISLTITSPAATAHRSTGGFTLHRSLHDAGRVLTVVAGVLLIALAVLVPLGVLVAIATWVWAATLRRRREGALGP